MDQIPYEDARAVLVEELSSIANLLTFDYTYEDFSSGTEPYKRLYALYESPFAFQQARLKMAANAKAVKFNGFNAMLNSYIKAEQSGKRHVGATNHTEFEDQYFELNCGEWETSDWGIYRSLPNGGRECACAHPIMPVERLVNIDTGEVKLTLAYKRSGRAKKWQTIIVDKAMVSTARTVTALASSGISVTSSTASALVDYLNDMENLNYDIIPEKKSIGRCGYIAGEGFSPFVDGLVFDGDVTYRGLYNTIREHGRQMDWYRVAEECRRISTAARVVLAASFASPLLSIVGTLPFFVHLWGVDSGTGKTVALMLAASVWGNPALGSYLQTFNATQVGQERTAAFLNQLPFCVDELQLTKDSKGRSNFDVYQLAQGVGRSRGRRSGGIDLAPTWSCCFLTSGESPLTSVSSGAGAVNRVVDVECTAGHPVITDGPRIAGLLKQHYGWAGVDFLKYLYPDTGMEERHATVREIYSGYFRELCQSDTTEKQAMAAAAILTADQLATYWLFADNNNLTVEEIKTFLASKEAVSAGKRAYDWLCDWVASNANHFAGNDAVTGEIYGIIEYNTAYIIRKVFNDMLTNAGYSVAATLSYLKSNSLIETRGRANTKHKRICGVSAECVVLKLRTLHDDDDGDDLPL